MRRDLIVGAILSLSPSMALAQQCDAPAVCAPQCAPQCSEPFKNAPPKPKGNFLRGPATGQRAGESRSLGIRGPALHIPELRLALPTLELPSPVQFVRDAEMLFDQGRGAFSTAAVQDFGNLGEDDKFKDASPRGDNFIPAGPAPCSAPQYYCPPACAVPSADTSSLKLEATLARLESLERELATLREAAAAQDGARQPASASSRGVNGASKSSTAPMNVKGSRPASNSQFIQAHYEEAPSSAPVTTKRAASPAVKSTASGQGLKGLSAPPVQPTSNEKSEFGTWSRQTR